MSFAFDIAPLTARHADAAQRLTAAVGWSHRHEDWLLALSVGYGLGAFDPDGGLRGTLVWFPYGAAHAALGLVTVDPALQRSGIGRGVMARALADTGRRTVLLVSTEAGRRLYDRLGFCQTGSNAAHMGVAVAIAAADAGVGPAAREHLPAIQALDRVAQGFPRDALIAELAAVGEVAVLHAKGGIAGFAVCRRFGKGHVVGPVVAPACDMAQRLIAWWLRRRAGELVRLDVPAEHAELAAWLNAQGLPRGSESPIMVRGVAPLTTGTVHRYALASQAMG